MPEGGNNENIKIVKKRCKMAKVEQWLTEDRIELLTAWARDGYTKSDIARMIDIAPKTLREWAMKYPQIAEALSHSRELVDYKVENALLKRCLGYKTTKKRIVVDMEKGTTKTETEESELAPDPTSIAIWLNNRKPDQWKRNRDNFMSIFEDGDQNLEVNIIRQKADGSTEERSASNKNKINKKESEEDPWAEISDEDDIDEDW